MQNLQSLKNQTWKQTQSQIEPPCNDATQRGCGTRSQTAWNCRLKLQLRKAAAEKRNLLLISCLRPQHANPADCKYFRKVCLECSATHHPLLCPARDKRLKSTASRLKDSENAPLHIHFMTFTIATSVPLTRVREWIFSEYSEQCYSRAAVNGVFGSNI